MPKLNFVQHSAWKVDKLVSSTVEGISSFVDDLMRLLKEIAALRKKSLR